MPWSSNATFLVCLSRRLRSAARDLQAAAGRAPALGLSARARCATARSRRARCRRRWAGRSCPTPCCATGRPGIGMMQRFVHHDPEEHYFTLLADARRRVPADGRVRHRDQQHRPQGRPLPARRRRRHLRHRPRRVVPRAVEGAHGHLGLRVRADPARGVRRPAPARRASCAATSATGSRRCSTASSSTRVQARVGHLLATGEYPDADRDYHSYPWPTI